jgi:P4 family phage/plasmid primase-like protien
MAAANPSTMNYKSLDEFLKDHKYVKGSEQPITHTRIGDKTGGVYAGAYSIPPEKMSTFYELYCTKVFPNSLEKNDSTKSKSKATKSKHYEYLTEKQNDGAGPILIDFDFRYKIEIKERQHSDGHVIDIVDLYLRMLKEMVDFNDTPFPVYIFQKPNVNVIESDNLTKDGIHMIIGLDMDHKAQLHLRSLVLKEIGEVWSDLPMVNSWESVLDEGISAGYTNWQLFGSRKPGHESYQLTHHYSITYDMDDGEFSFNKNELKTFDLCKHMEQLSAKYTKHMALPLNAKTKQIIEENESSGKPKRDKKKILSPGPSLALSQGDLISNYNAIKDEAQLDALIDAMLTNVSTIEHHIEEAHKFALILPKKYYESGSYCEWIRVGWALKNTDHRLFLTWLKLSSQSSSFSWADVSELYDQWCDFETDKDGLTYKSILYWAKNDAPRDKYNEIRTSTVDHFIEESLKGATEFDLANVLLQLYKDRFICVSIKNNIWYEFKNHKWSEIDSGNTLRLAISKEMHQRYTLKIQECVDQMCALSDDDPNKEKIHKKTQILSDIAKMLKRTNNKNNIMREARELFYDSNFLEQQDENNYLLCFNNGVFDFTANVFRDGKPEDYITKCTNIDYVPLNKVKNKKYIKETQAFIEQLFPVKELRDYMWEHLASTLIGTNENQTFNIYTGTGANGKSKLVDLMSLCLGEYKGTVPITLITQKRNSIGGTSSEVAQLKGKRYAVMQEPSKGDVINEGIMKEITGGDPIQARALFKETITFIPQFKLCVCTNTLFDIKSTDDGTWRRIRVCDFMSKFKENPVDGDPDYPYQFPIDKKIDAKFEKWKIPFMSLLVEIAKVKKGLVSDCKIVMGKSDSYRKDQDCINEFVEEKVEKREGGKIKKTEIYEVFKQWYTLEHGKNVPKGKELYEYMNKKFGKYKTAWHGVAILYETEDDEIEDC